MTKRRIVILTTEALPGLGLATAGGGVRAFALGQALKTAGHEVIYSLPRSIVNKIPPDIHPKLETLRTYSHDMSDPTIPVTQACPDIVIVEQWQPLSRLGKLDAPIVVDLPGPLVLENAFRKIDTLHTAAGAKIRALQKADAFLYTNPRQKSYWLAWLMLAGVSLDRDYLLHAPICRSPELPPPPTGEAGVRFIHGGLFWPWQDPSLPLRILVEVMEDRHEGVLDIFGGRHPHHGAPNDVYLDPKEVLPASERIRYHDVMPLEELESEYAKGGVALELAAPNPERELASTIRTIGFLWCGLPVVANDYSYLAQDILCSGAGWDVDPSDPQALRETFTHILEQKSTWAMHGAAAGDLARRKYVWPGALQSLLAYCETPFRRPKGVGYLEETRSVIDSLKEMTVRQKAEIEGLAKAVEDQDRQIRDRDNHIRAKSEELEEAYRRLRNRWRSKLARKFRGLLGGS